MAGKKSASSSLPTLTTLPPVALARIAAHVLHRGAGPPPPAGVTITAANARDVGAAAVVLARTHGALRRAAAAAVSGLCFGEAAGAWPAARALGPRPGEAVVEVCVAVDRGTVAGFYKWMLGVGGLEVLRLRVFGRPYARAELAGLERVLLGRVLFQAGRTLREVEVAGVDTKAVLMSAVCRCSRLRRLSVGWYDAGEGGVGGGGEGGEEGASVTMYIFVLLCLVNRAGLVDVAHPFGKTAVPERAALAEGLQATWGTLWGNYRAGAKEAAANLPAEADEMRATFDAVSAQMDEIEGSMTEVMTGLAEEPADAPRDASFEALLRRLLPKVSLVSSTV